jgi:four helix bundle protein
MHRYEILLNRIKAQNLLIINSSRTLNLDIPNRVMILQLIKSSTSIGANYTEACQSTSLKDRIAKLSICKKESSETVYWLELIMKSNNGNLNMNS